MIPFQLYLAPLLKALFLLTASSFFLVACGGSDGGSSDDSGFDDGDDDDDDIDVPAEPPINTSMPRSVDGTWRTNCVFIPGSFFGQYQIREYIRAGTDTAYITDYFNDSACTDSRDNQLLMRGTSEFVQDVEESVFGVTTKAVNFVATEFYLGGNLVDSPVDPFKDLVYVVDQTKLLLGNSETVDDVTGIPAALDWVVSYTYQGEPVFP